MSLAIKMLKEMIAIPSQIGIDMEKAMAEYLCRILRSNRFDVRTYEFLKDRPNIVAEYKFIENGPTIIFNGHMDTKPAGNGEENIKWNTDPFVATIFDGKVFGLGACDMKGGIAAALAAIIRCVNENSGRGKIIVNFVSDEESTSLYGTVPVCKNGLISGDLAIVMEPTECHVCRKQMGNMFFKTRIIGKGGHTGIPEGKINPFFISYDYVDKLKQWILTKRVNKDDLQPFINIGSYEGGTSSGTIPSECVLFWGTRVMPSDNFYDYVEEISEITNLFNLRLPSGCRVITELFEGGGIDSFSCKSGFTDRLIKKSGVVEDIFCASSDAGFIYNILNINSCIFGPGSLKQAHLPNEFVEIEQLEKCEEVIYDFLSDCG